MGVIWALASVIVLVFGLGADPWDAARDALKNQGASEDSKSVMAYVAGYTLPFTAAMTGLTLAWLLGAAKGKGPWAVGGVITLALWGSAVAAADLGLGLLPSSAFEPVNGPWFIAFPADAFRSYGASYGGPLMVCSLAISVAAAIQFERWTHKLSEL
jgi:hypothetical protein